MAKVTFSAAVSDIRGKVGNTIVFSNWKGRPTLRRWLKPANPMTADQGDQRLILGGTGRAASVADKNGDYVGQMNTLGLIPGGQSKQSALVKQIINTFLYDSVTKLTKYENEYSAYAAHSAKSSIDTQAANVGLVTFDVTYKGTTHSFVAGLQLYLLARYAIANAFTGSPYTTALASWTNTEFGALVDDLNAA
jgi:hypothetical protein